MKFGFLVHPLANETDRVLEYLREVDLQRSFERGAISFFHDLHLATERARRRKAQPARPAGVTMIDEMRGLRSVLGATAEGRIYEIPMSALAIVDDPHRALAYMREAVDMATDWGAVIVGLGAMTGVVGGGGSHLAGQVKAAVTTGNSLTVYSAVANLTRACEDLGLPLEDEVVAVVGVPGSIASAAARLLKGRCKSLVLVARQPSPRATALATELDAELTIDIPGALSRARVALTATSSGGCIEQSWLAPGAIVSDVGVPTDVRGGRVQRDDVLILSGGLCMVPATMPWTSHYLWFHRGSMAACVAETLVLALDEAPESLSLGRNLEPDRIAHIGKRAEAHGFDFTRLFSFGQPLDDAAFAAYRKALARTVRRPRSDVRLPELAASRYRRHVNPPMVALGEGLVPTFVRGEGSRVWDADGKSYIDCLAGYGSLNLGHNHPEVVAAVRAALDEGAPGFSPAAVNPRAAALAEELASVAPAGLEMTFFCNSGAEAVEAALKLARRATQRTDFLSCERGFHGKTLGALSVTGNPRYQRPFAPLVPGREEVPFGDVPALERALAGRRFAAFVVEPVQAEGGIHVAPDGYLRAAQELCRRAGTLLVVDEVQTGMGRTGPLFAVEEQGVEPDIMTLAKSLGGGLVPIGAMLTRRDHWQKAYGSLETFSLHSTTFGGGSLACAAGLATLRVLRESDVLTRARARGRELTAGLRRIAAESPIVREVRGEGLLFGVEFEPPPQPTAKLWRDIVAGGTRGIIATGVEDVLESLTATWVMTLLMREHGIYTQVARSSPRVLRIEPPLVLGEDEATEVLDAFGSSCAEVAACFASFDEMIAKAVLGRYGDQG